MQRQTIHRMAHSDNLEALSAKYRVPVCMIMRANGLVTPDQIAVCREVKIPCRCYCNRCEGKAEAQTADYVVQSGDSAYGIARRFGLTMRILLKDNGLEDPEDLRPGDSVSIPAVSGEICVAREGESLDDIARRYSITAQSIRSLNRLEPDEKIFPGMVLMIPQE